VENWGFEGENRDSEGVWRLGKG